MMDLILATITTQVQTDSTLVYGIIGIAWAVIVALLGYIVKSNKDVQKSMVSEIQNNTTKIVSNSERIIKLETKQDSRICPVK